MKITILVLLTVISMNCFSQSISEVTIYSQPLSNPFTITLKVNNADTVSLTIYDFLWKPKITIFNNELLSKGTYRIDYSLSEALTSGVYRFILKTTKDTISKLLISQDMNSTTGSIDVMKITFTDSLKNDKITIFDKMNIYETTKVTIKDTIKVIDTVKVTFVDTTRLLIIDTINCTKTATTLRNYETFSKTESLSFHDNLILPFSEVDKLVLYDLTGKYLRNIMLSSNVVQLQDLKNGIYIGLFYESGNLIKTMKLIKE